jgi:ureidoglycolate lyase
MLIKTQPLTQDLFAPFGQVLMADKGLPEYNAWTGKLENLRAEATLNITYMSMAPSAHPALITVLERHPFSHQMFVPLEGTQHLVVVCPSLEDGKPDLSRVKTFHAAGGQTVIYSANVWHAPRTVLVGPGSFIMLRWDARTELDTEFLSLENPFEVSFPQ